MFSLLRLLLTTTLLVVAAYFVFWKDIGGKPLAGHVADVWGSDLVQRKVASIKDDVREDLEERLAKAKAEKAAKADDKKHDGYDIINDADRESLSQLIEKKTQSKK